MTKPSAGWAVELTGEPIDLDDLREFLAPPFDPWVEDFEEEGSVKLLLRSKAWEGITDSSRLVAHAAKLVERLNGAELLLQSDARPVATNAIMKFDGAGRRVPIVIAASGHITLRGARARGRITAISDDPPPPPKPSRLQTWLGAAETDDDRADLFEHLARADNWYEIYKTAEIIRRIAGGHRALNRVIGTLAPEWSRVCGKRQTATVTRPIRLSIPRRLFRRPWQNLESCFSQWQAWLRDRSLPDDGDAERRFYGRISGGWDDEGQRLSHTLVSGSL